MRCYSIPFQKGSFWKHRAGCVGVLYHRGESCTFPLLHFPRIAMCPNQPLQGQQQGPPCWVYGWAVYAVWGYSRFIRHLFSWSHPNSDAFGPVGCPLWLFLPLSPHCLNMSSGSSFSSQCGAGRMFFLSPYLKRIMNHWEKALLLIRLFFSIWGKSNDWNINLIWTVLKYLFFNIDRNFAFAFWFCTFKEWTRKTLNH